MLLSFICSCLFWAVSGDFLNLLGWFQVVSDGFRSFRVLVLNVVKVGHKFLLPVGNNWNSFVKFRRLAWGHTCHIKRATCNILICLGNIVILRKSGVKKLIFFLNNLYLDIVDTMLLV